jgi:hypothetical protein
MAEQISHIRLKLDGEMTCRFHELTLQLDAAVLRVLFEEERNPYHVELHLSLTQAEDVKALGQTFSELSHLYTLPPFHFGFSMTPSVLAQHAKTFAGVERLEDWITVAEGACFALDNYEYIGRVDSFS